MSHSDERQDQTNENDAMPDDELITEDGSVPDLVYENHIDWVEDWLAPVYEQLITAGRAWCPEWWRHPGASVRLHALWHSWEVAITEGGSAMATWFVKLGDPMMNEVTRADGTFRGCKDYAEGRDATKWLIDGESWAIEEAPDYRLVQQQAPKPHIFEDGTREILIPEVDGVEYRKQELSGGNVLITAHAKPGCRLHTGHKVERPHPRGELPTTTP